MSANGTIELPPIIITPNPPPLPPLQPPRPIPGGGYIAKPQPWVKGVGPITKLSDLRINLDHPSSSVSIFVVAAGSIKNIGDAYQASVPKIPANLELEVSQAIGSNADRTLDGLRKEKALMEALLLAKQVAIKNDTVKSNSFFGRPFLSKDFKQNGVDFVNRIFSHRDKDAYYNVFIAAGIAAYNVKVLAEEIRILTEKTKTLATKVAAAQAAEKAKAEAEAKRLAEEKAKAEAEAKRLAEEKAKAEAEAKRLAEEKAKADEELKGAIKFTADFYKDVSERFSTQMSSLAQQMSEDAKGKVLRSADEALRAFDQYKGNLNKKFNAADRAAIVNALESLDRSELAKNLDFFGKAFGYVGKAIDATDLLVEIKKSYKTGDWNGTVLKVETLFAGAAATGLIAFAFGLSVSTPMGIVAFALIMALVSAFVDDARVKMFNDALDSILSR
ncbi:colicin transporter [Pseudomonas sp. SWRI92]|uniref:colicin-like pore-forming protein n=1 Tax=Pseudomonas sp. SWRI92 TaxID=2745499 RepID=UPI001644F073|nr:colicin-like pore-forming protein [Pseudomonas sp. SWRI92]MBC3373704.1 colicin transporter [Pseudomonas sp. SWRI92]